MTYFYDELYAKTIERWPVEDVVAFVERNRAELRNAAACDLGCGAGRHAVFMAGRGLKVCGLDRSPVGIAHAREWARRESVPAEFQAGDLRMLPYRDGSFAAVISWEAIFYGSGAEVTRSIAEAFRVLRRGGRFLISLKSAGDYRTREFLRQGPNTFATEQGLPMTFFDRAEIERMFCPMSVELNVELFVRSQQNGARLRENFIVTGRKK